MDTNTVQVIESFGTKLDTYITALASKAGVAADHFYPIFVTQQRIEGITSLACWVILAVITVFVIRFSLKNISLANDKEKSYGEQGTAEIKSIVSGIAGAGSALILLISFGSSSTATIGKIINPEYTAVQSLVKMVK